MKRKNKMNLWLKTSSVLLIAVFFVSSGKLSARTSSVLINEIQTAGVSANDEFIELYNPTSDAIDISNWSIQYRGGSGNTYYKKNFISGSAVPAEGYFLIAHGGSGNYSGTVPYDMSWSQSLSSAGGNIFLVNNQTVIADSNSASIMDKVAYGLTDNLEHTPAVAPEEGRSIGRIEGKDTDNDLKDFFVLENPSPKKENEKAKEKIPDPPKTYPTGIVITELFPNTFQSQYEEYIELYNGSDEDVDLFGWSLRDASKAGKYVFTESVVLKAKKYMAIFKKDFKFALNNSGDESVTLFDPNGKEVAKASYDGSKKNVSYNFDGLRWRWSKFLTPGEENVLNNEPYGKLKIDGDVYTGVYADFSVSTGDADGDRIKVTWNFGDGHKSYLAKTRHKFLKMGVYNGSVKLSDGSEDVVKNFKVEVQKFPHPEIKIVAVNANPAGADTGVEYITLQNKSKKKINLNGWSIATGWKDFINHPIRVDVVIKSGKEKQLTNEDASFTLNNSKSKIQLKYPDGKVASEVKYKSPNKAITDGEIYQKIKEGWIWVGAQKSSVISHQSSENSTASSVTENAKTKEDDKYEITDEVVLGVEVFKKENKFLTIRNENVKIELLKNQPRVLGAETVREIDGIYFLTSQSIQKDHYIVAFLKNIFSTLNLFVNALLNSLK